MLIRICVVIFSVLLIVGCSEDENIIPTNNDNPCVGTVSYMDDIVPIINSTCALSGCHVAGFSEGDFTTYNDLKTRADNGRLGTRAVTVRDMPPSDTNGPKSLSDSQIEAFRCWIKAGAPNN